MNRPPTLSLRGLGGTGLAVTILLMPFALGPVLARGVPAGGLIPSAAHRLLIWDFVVERIAERPLLGWGMEASRTIPGHAASPPPALLERFGLTGPAVAVWLPVAQMLPLHPHNGALQLRVSEALTLLPMLTPAAVPGLFVGCLAANLICGAPLADIVFGSLATLLAALPPVLCNGVIVGVMLSVVYSVPLFYSCLTVAGGEALACYVLGIPLLKGVEKLKIWN